MKSYLHYQVTAILLACATSLVVGGSSSVAGAQTNDAGMNVGVLPQRLELTTAQRTAIYEAVSRDKSKVAPRRFATAVGAEVPAMIELYALPDNILADNPATKLYKYTRVDDRVVLVDPTKMRVIAVIGPMRQE